MRIIGGEFKGHRLEAPSGRDVRPTPARVREALFSMLGGLLTGHRFVDLYAGAGTVGLEALSRGAEPVFFVERDKRALGFLNRNLRACRAGERGRVLEASAEDIDSAIYQGTTILFLDPPYGVVPRLSKLRQHLDEVNHPPVIIYQHGLSAVAVPWLPDRMGLLDERRYGKTMLSVYSQREEDT